MPYTTSRLVSDFPPSVLPTIKPGSRFALSSLQGVADVPLLTRHLEQHHAAMPMLVVVYASVVDAQRLAEELR